MEQTKRQLKKPPKLEDGLGRPCNHCGTGGSCRSRCAVCSLHAASACAYKLCKPCCTTRGVCDYHKSQPPTKRRSASEPNSQLAQSTSGNQKLTAISSIDRQRGNERDSVTGGESERTGKSNLDGLKVFWTTTPTPKPIRHCRNLVTIFWFRCYPCLLHRAPRRVGQHPAAPGLAPSASPILTIQVPISVTKEGRRIKMKKMMNGEYIIMSLYTTRW